MWGRDAEECDVREGATDHPLSRDIRAAAMTGPQAPRGRRRRTIVTAAAWLYLVVWIATAVEPVDRYDWFLENLLVFALAAVLVASYRRFPLSDASYLCMLAFLAMHAVGAHYTYSLAPPGFALSELLGLTRNHYDRAIHFAFGLLFALPVREVLLRTSNLRGLRRRCGRKLGRVKQ